MNLHIIAPTLLLVATAPHGAAQTIARWTFDEGVAGQKFAAVPNAESSGHHYQILGDPTYGPTYSDITVSGRGLSSRHENQDGYTTDPVLNRWSPERWTIEISVRLDTLEGRNIIISRDGSSEPDRVLSDFCLESSADDNRFVLSFTTVGGKRYTVRSNFVPMINRWYHIALVSDGRTVAMYVEQPDDPGYRLAGSIVMSGPTSAHNALASTGDFWTFGRGWENKNYVHSIRGYIDDIRFTGRALDPSEFLHSPAIAEP